MYKTARVDGDDQGRRRTVSNLRARAEGYYQGSTARSSRWKKQGHESRCRGLEDKIHHGGFKGPFSSWFDYRGSCSCILSHLALFSCARIPVSCCSFCFYCSYSWEGSLGSLGCVPLFTREIACVLYFLANGFSPSRRLLPAGQVLASIWFLMLRYFQ